MLHDVHYQHWKGTSVTIWTRRWVIARQGLSECLQNKILRSVIILGWAIALATVGTMFFVSQLLVPDSMVMRWIEQLNPQLQSFARMLTYWLHDHPEISVRTTQNVLFFFICTILTTAGIFALGLAMPVLITRDLGSSAIVIYSSKAISRMDYLFGKFCTAFGLLAMMWLGPVCAAWFLGNLLAPDWSFFWHARLALFNILVYSIVAMAVLSVLALGMSAVSSREKSTPFFWIMWWIVGASIQGIASNTRPWLRHISFSYNITQLRLATFRLGDDIKIAHDNIPLLGEMLKNISSTTMESLNSPTIFGAMFGLLLMLAGAAWIVNRKVRPE